MKPLVKTKTRFNLLDAVIICVLLLLAALLVFYFVPRNEQGESASVVLELSRVRDEFVPLLSEGDAVYDQSGTVRLGTIRSIEKTREQLTLPDATTGENTSTLYPVGTLSHVTLTVALENAIPEDGGLSVGSVQLLRAEPVFLRTERFSMTAHCTQIVFGEVSA